MTTLLLSTLVLAWIVMASHLQLLLFQVDVACCVLLLMPVDKPVHTRARVVEREQSEGLDPDHTTHTTHTAALVASGGDSGTVSKTSYNDCCCLLLAATDDDATLRPLRPLRDAAVRLDAAVACVAEAAAVPPRAPRLLRPGLERLTLVPADRPLLAERPLRAVRAVRPVRPVRAVCAVRPERPDRTECRELRPSDASLYMEPLEPL